jgi:hypothetical protein
VYHLPRARQPPIARGRPPRGDHQIPSGGNALQAHPPRTREVMACKTSRLVCVRGCPPGIAGGLRGSRMLHSASVTSRGEGLRLRDTF